MLFIRDRVLSLDSDAGSEGQPFRIRKEDCSVEILSVNDFDVGDEDEDEKDIRKLKQAEECVEKVMLCWWSTEHLISNFWNGSVEASRPVYKPADEIPGDIQGSRNSSEASFEMPVFDSIEYSVGSWESSTSISGDWDEPSPRDVGGEFVKTVNLGEIQIEHFDTKEAGSQWARDFCEVMSV